MKKSFLIHIDSLCVLEELSNEQRGELFYAIYSYQKDIEIELSSIVKIAFSQFKNQFIRDDEKYEKTVEARRQAGAMGGKQRVANQANATNSKQTKANQAVNKNKKDNKNKSDNDFIMFWSAYPKKQSKEAAKKSFSKIYRELPSINSLVEIIKLNSLSESWRKDNGKFIPMASTWLNNKRWTDEIAPMEQEPLCDADYWGGSNG